MTQKRIPFRVSAFTFLLFPEDDFSRFRICGLDNCQRFQFETQIPNPVAAFLKALFDYDAAANHFRAGRIDDGNQALQRAAVGKKIIHDQHMVILAQVLF